MHMDVGERLTHMEVGGEPAEGIEPLPGVGGVLHALVVEQDELLLHPQSDGLHLLHNLRAGEVEKGGVERGDVRRGRVNGEGWEGEG